MAVFPAFRRARLAAALTLFTSLAAGQPAPDPRPLPPPPPPGTGSPVPPPPPPPTSAAAATPPGSPQPPAQSAEGPPPTAADPHAELHRPTAELWLGFGLGGAACDDKKPDSDCPIDGAFTFMLGGAWRFAPHFAFGGELSTWSFHVRDSWRGQLTGTSPSTSVDFSSYYVAPVLRWYWFDHGPVDPYLQAGVGLGAVKGHAEDAAGNTYDVQVSGAVVPLAIGAEAYLGEHFRLGVQALAYLQASTKKCETTNDNGEECQDSGKDDNALPWRLIVALSYVWGRK